MTELSPEACKLIETARGGDDPSDVERARVRVSVAGVVGAASFGASIATTHGAAAAAAGAAGVQGAAGLASGAGVKLALWFGASSLVTAGALFGGYAVVNRTTDSRQDRSASVRIAEPAPRMARAGQQVAQAGEAEAAAIEPPTRIAPAERPAARAVRTPPRQPGPSPSREARQVEASRAAGSVGSLPTASDGESRSQTHSLSEETALIRAAQARLNVGQPGAALEKLRQHEQQYPSGSLVPERLAARVHALCASGRASEAARVARQLQTMFPTSPLLQRVRASCASGGFSATESKGAGN